MLASIAHVGSINAVEMLTADHDKLRELSRDFERQHNDGLGARAEETARQLCRKFSIHAQVEAEIFYPEARAAIAHADIVQESKAEHAIVECLIRRIMAGSIQDRKYAALVKVLCESMRRHMSAEEAQMFRLVHATDLDMNEIGARIIARKHDLEIESDLANDAGPLQRRKARVRRKFNAQTAERLRHAS